MGQRNLSQRGNEYAYLTVEKHSLPPPSPFLFFSFLFFMYFNLVVFDFKVSTLFPISFKCGHPDQ